MFETAKDNMNFTNNQTGEEIIFHRKTWLYSIFGILTHYLRYTNEHAKKLMADTELCSDRNLDFHSISMLCHEEEYHWAMIISYGEEYWSKGFNVELPDDYDEWIDDYRKNYNLNDVVCD